MKAHKGGSHVVHGFAHPARNIASLQLQPDMVAADFGAGSGAYVFALAETLPQGRVYAVDIQKDLLRRIHNEAISRGFNNVDILWGDLEAPHGSKLADRIADVVVISNMLFQVADKHAVLREARRVVRDDGQVVVIEWSDSFDGLGPHKQDVVPQDTVLDVAEREGLKAYSTFPAGAHHYGIVFIPEEARSEHLHL